MEGRLSITVLFVLGIFTIACNGLGTPAFLTNLTKYPLKESNFTTIPGTFNSPRSILPLNDGSFFVTDSIDGVRFVGTDGSQRKYGNLPAIAEKFRSNGLAMDRHGNLLVADSTLPGRIYKIDREENTTVFWENPFKGLVSSLDIDTKGRIWVAVSTKRSDPMLAMIHPMEDGSIVRIDPNGNSTKVADNLQFCSEVRVAPSGDFLIATEATTKKLYRFNIHSNSSLGKKTFYVEVFGMPDGYSFDEEGNIWSTHYWLNSLGMIFAKNEFATYCSLFFSDENKNTSTAFLHKLKNHVFDVHEVPGLYGSILKLPTSIVFGGPDRKTAYVASSVDQIKTFQAPVAGAKRVYWDKWNSTTLVDKTVVEEEPLPVEEITSTPEQPKDEL